MAVKNGVVLFVEGKPVECEVELYENAINFKGFEYAFTEISTYLFGPVLFLDFRGGIFLPIIPTAFSLNPREFYEDTVSDFRRKIDEVENLIESVKSKKISSEQAEKIRLFLAENCRIVSSENVESVFYSTDMIKVSGVVVDGKDLSAVWDAGTTIDVFKKQISSGRQIGTATVRTLKNVQVLPKFTGVIEIRGKKLPINYLVDENLPFDALLSTKTVDSVAKSFDFKRRRLVY